MNHEKAENCVSDLFFGLVAATGSYMDSAQKVKIGIIHILGKHPDHITLRQGFLKLDFRQSIA
ncbi:hypothetical protein QUF90_21325 [Desulfococcaceae bacterium HSG9]|nr:hypothetical protein [Desulfococcaceae bacterium HSG9]